MSEKNIVESKKSEKTKEKKNVKPFYVRETTSSRTIDFLNELSTMNLFKMNHIEMARENLQAAKRLANKKQAKMNSNMKYFHCKNCDMKLMPDSTSTARIKHKGKNKLIVIKCKSCDRIKRYKINEKEKK